MARIAWYSSNYPFPPRGGADVRVSGLIDLVLAEGHQILLVHTRPKRPDQGCEVDSVVVPEYHGFGRRVRRLIRTTPVSSALPDPGGLAVARRALARFKPEVSVMSELFTWPVVSRLRGTSPLVYDAHNFELDLHAQLRSLVMAAPHRVLAQVDHPRVAQVERRVLAASSAVWATSEDDRRGLLGTCPTAQVWVAPNSCATPPVAADPATSDQRLLFVGNLGYEPNIRAVETLALTILPAVRQHCPEARLMLVGSNVAASVARLTAELPYVDLHVDVADLAPFYSRARLVVVPMEHGSGTNIKVIESLAHGVPVIATPVALRGIPVDEGEGVWVRASHAAIAEAAATLLQDPTTAGSLGRLGRDVFLERLAWPVASQAAVTAGLQQALAEC